MKKLDDILCQATQNFVYVHISGCSMNSKKIKKNRKNPLFFRDIFKCENMILWIHNSIYILNSIIDIQI